jgi:hypothetical protein
MQCQRKSEFPVFPVFPAESVVWAENRPTSDGAASGGRERHVARDE